MYYLPEIKPKHLRNRYIMKDHITRRLGNDGITYNMFEGEMCKELEEVLIEKRQGRREIYTILYNSRWDLNRRRFAESLFMEIFGEEGLISNRRQK